MSPQNLKKIIGVGSPIVDLLAQVSEEFVAGIEGDKGGMELVTPEQIEALVGQLSGAPVIAPGGSAANTIFALAKVGVPSAFLGKLGEDALGATYRDAFAALGGDIARFKSTNAAPTARCLSLVTPDSERTMRTELGAAALMAPEEVTADDFAGCALAHIEGYLLFNPALAHQVLSTAKAAGCTVSLDLGAFEVVRAAGDNLPRLLEEFVDIVYANEDEAEAFTGSKDPIAALDALGKLCDIAVVKLGAEGAIIDGRGERVTIAPRKAKQVIDTTGAGDFWAAGFLYGYLHGLPLQVAGSIGSLFGAEVVQHMGVDLEPEAWQRVEDELGRLKG